LEGFAAAAPLAFVAACVRFGAALPAFAPAPAALPPRRARVAFVGAAAPFSEAFAGAVAFSAVSGLVAFGLVLLVSSVMENPPGWRRATIRLSYDRRARGWSGPIEVHAAGHGALML